MTEVPFHRDNHYVAREYLKYWASYKRIWTYRTLVSHPQVPLWKESSLRGVAYQSHLYTRVLAGSETDEIEQWLDREFEAPAAEALRRATSSERLSPDDWKYLVRFLAAQDVRTPARLVENLRRWTETIPGLMEEVLHESVRKLESAKNSHQAIQQPKQSGDSLMPFRLTTQTEVGQGFTELKAETIAGRGLWLFSMKYVLTQTMNVLHKHHWTILYAPEDSPFITSDDPVIRLNYYSHDKYDFGGGWASPGTEIFLPLSPSRLLYTQVGKHPRRWERLSEEKAKMIRQFTAEHAHRMIFAANPDEEITELRPRIVDAGLLRHEQEQWRKWHEEQTAAERELMGWSRP